MDPYAALPFVGFNMSICKRKACAVVVEDVHVINGIGTSRNNCH